MKAMEFWRIGVMEMAKKPIPPILHHSSFSPPQSIRRGFVERVQDDAWREQIGKNFRRFVGVFGINQHQRHTGALITIQFRNDGCILHITIFYQRDGIDLLELGADAWDFQRSFFIHLAIGAPLRCEIHQDRTARSTRFLERIRTPWFPIDASRFRSFWMTPVEFLYQQVTIGEHKNCQRYDHRKPAPTTPALDEFTPNPHTKRDCGQKQTKQQIAELSEKRSRQREQINRGSQHWKTHGDFELLHPCARLREKLQQRRFPRENDVRSCQAETDDQKNQHDHRRWLEKSKTESAPQKWRRARRGQNGREQAIQECACGTFARRQFAGRTHYASTEIEFEDAEKIERDHRYQNRHHDKELRILKLHSPACCMAHLPHQYDQSRQCKERNQHAGCIQQSKFAHARSVFLGLIYKAQNFERDHRQHTGHYVENYSTDKRIENHQPERLRRQGVGKRCRWRLRECSVPNRQTHFISGCPSIGFLQKQSGNVCRPAALKFLESFFEPNNSSLRHHKLRVRLHIRFIARIGIKIGIHDYANRGNRPFENDSACVCIRRTFPKRARAQIVFGYGKLFLPFGYQRSVRRGSVFIADVQSGMDVLVAGDALGFAFEPAHVSFQIKWTWLGVLGDFQRHEQDDFFFVDIRGQIVSRKFCRDRPLNFTGGDPRRKLPVDARCNPRTAGIAPIGVPARFHGQANAGHHGVAWARRLRAEDECSLCRCGMGRSRRQNRQQHQPQ